MEKAGMQREGRLCALERASEFSVQPRDSTVLGSEISIGLSSERM